MEGATPFFGAKISLISKSEIRYEGVLYTIDPKESTIALAKVRSFGTENRNVDRPVPPRDEIFEFIIFRASDIKDLVVDDAPGQAAAQPPQPVFEDPAIVKSAPAGSSGSSSIAAAAISAAAGSSQASTSKPTENGSSSQPDKKPATTGAPKPAWGGVNALNNLQNNVQQQQQNRQQNQRGGPGGDNQQQQHRQPRQYNNQQSNMNNYNNQRQGGFGGQQRGGFRGMQGGPQGFRPGPQGSFGPQGGQRYNNRMDGGQQQRFGGNRGGMRGMGGRPGGHYHQGHRQSGPIKFAPLPDGEFDFEKAHSDFQMLEEKLKSLKLNGSNNGEDSPGSSADLPPIEGIPASAITVSALEEEEEIPSEPCYNKSTSFFDNISCEAVEREKGTVKRVDWKAERSLNKETFGVSSARPTHQRFYNNNRGGGRFHNGGGYGGHGGGFNSRGRGGYQNRDRNAGQREQRVSNDQVA